MPIQKHHAKIVSDLWREQPGEYFFISAREGTLKTTTSWKDYAFIRNGKSFITNDDQINLPNFLEKNAHCDLYFCPHGFSKPNRQEQCAVPGKLLYADLDESDPRKLDDSLRPTISWETSPGRYHGIWLADDVVDNKLNQRLTYACKADKGGWGYTKVLRIPGTNNYKYATMPRIRVIDYNSERVVSKKEYEQILPKINFESSENNAQSPTQILRKYGPKILGATRTKLLQKNKPDVGKRSDVLFELANSLLEAGLAEDEIFTLLSASVWNKYEGRHDEANRVNQTINNAIEKKLNGKIGKKKFFTRISDEEAVEPSSFRMAMIPISEIEEEEIHWLWRPYFARGEVTIFEGDPAIGKSFTMQMICKAFLDGERLPEVKGNTIQPIFTAKKIIYFSDEDDPARVTRKRMNWANVKRLTNFIQETLVFTIEDEGAIAEADHHMSRFKPDLVVFDPLNTYIGEVDTYKAGEARKALGVFLGLARKHNCSVVVVRHLTKGKGPAMYRGQGSIALSGTARVVVVCGSVPDDMLDDVEGYEEGDDVRAMAVTKLNIGRKPPPLAYSISSAPTLKDPDRAEFKWGGFIQGLNADRMLNAEPTISISTGKAAEDARDFLLRSLLEKALEGPRLVEMAKTRSISKTTLYRAAKALEDAELLSRDEAEWKLTSAGIKAANASKPT